MEPSTTTLAPITSTNEAKASMSTASSTASTTSDSPSKSPLWRLPPDVLTNLQPSYWTRRSSHGPPDGGPAGAAPAAGFGLGRMGGISGNYGIDNPSLVYGPGPAEAFEAVKAKAQWAEDQWLRLVLGDGPSDPDQ